MSCTLQDAGEFVQAMVGPAPSQTLLDCYQELLSLCARHHLDRALLVSLDADGTTQAALTQALEAMASGRQPPGLKLAIVAESPRAFELYANAERLAARQGILARAFRGRREAVEWLTGSDQRRAPR